VRLITIVSVESRPSGGSAGWQTVESINKIYYAVGDILYSGNMRLKLKPICVYSQVCVCVCVCVYCILQHQVAKSNRFLENRTARGRRRSKKRSCKERGKNQYRARDLTTERLEGGEEKSKITPEQTKI
jgi:hypothetical protein